MVAEVRDLNATIEAELEKEISRFKLVGLSVYDDLRHGRFRIEDFGFRRRPSEANPDLMSDVGFDSSASGGEDESSFGCCDGGDSLGVITAIFG